MYNKLTISLLEYWYRGRPFPREEFLKYVEEVETCNGKIRPEMVQVELARAPPNRSLYLIGPPGVGKTSTCLRFGEAEGGFLGRRIIFMNLYNDPREVETILEEVSTDPGKYYLISYITGGEITREFYSIPVGAYLDLDKIIKLERSSSVQYWQLPARILIFTVMKTRPPLRLLLGEEPLSPEKTRELLEHVSMGLIIIDEALQSFPEFVRNYIMSLTGQRTWAGRQLSPLARLILIWNPREYNEAVLDPPLPTFRRGCIVHVDAPAREEVWNYFTRLYRESRGREPPFFLYTLLTVVSPILSTREEMRSSARRYMAYNTPASIISWLMELADICESEEECIQYSIYLARRYLSPESVNRLSLFYRSRIHTGEELLREPSLFRSALEEASKRGFTYMETVRYRMLINIIDEIAEKKERTVPLLARFIRSNSDLLTQSDLRLILNLARRRMNLEEWRRLVRKLRDESQSLPEIFRRLISEIAVTC